MTGFTHVLWPLVSDYLWVLSAQQDSLVSIYHSSVITCKYKSAQQQLLASIFNRFQAVYFSCRTSPTHKLSSNFLEAQSVSCVFCKLGSELNCNIIKNLNSCCNKSETSVFTLNNTQQPAKSTLLVMYKAADSLNLPIYIKSVRYLILIHIFFSLAFYYSSWILLFTPRVFWLRWCTY